MMENGMVFGLAEPTLEQRVKMLEETKRREIEKAYRNQKEDEAFSSGLTIGIFCGIVVAVAVAVYLNTGGE